MKKINLLITFLFIASSTFAQQLSESTKVSLITVEPGNELNDAFGHTILWVYDPANQIDKAYNFGEYDYSTDNFYWKFVRGQLPYKMGQYPIALYQQYYQKNNRKMTQQVMSFSLAQKQKIFDFLESKNSCLFFRIFTIKQ